MGNGKPPMMLLYDYDTDSFSLQIPMMPDEGEQLTEIELAFVELHAVISENPGIVYQLAERGLERMRTSYDPRSGGKAIN